MPADWRTIRVFISSTFLDMHAERDWLVKRVFPALRERLDRYRMHLVDVDLRWGVTREQVDSDQALDVCLEQIDESRPFFIGILGERYGFVSPSIPDRVFSKWGWIRHHTGKSITELEILYGVLNNPEMHSHALFFFRDPAFLRDVPEAKRGDMRAESKDSEGKLFQLKEAIRQAKLPVSPVENYPCRYAGLRVDWRMARSELGEADQHSLERIAADGLVEPAEFATLDDRLRDIIQQMGTVHLTGLEEFGDRVLESLWQVIKKEHDLPDQPPSATLAESDPLAAEQAYHERFIESRGRVYIGRESLQQSLGAFADGDDKTVCLVTGPSGSGKSAAMARFVDSYTIRHPETLVIPHFVGASPQSTGLRPMLNRLCSAMKAALGFAEEVPPDTNSLITTFRQFVAQIPADRRVVLVIDALNQLDESDNAHNLYWLPQQPPGQVKILVSCIADPDREEPVLKAFERQSCRRIDIEPLTDGERRAILREVPSLSAKSLDDTQINLLLSNPATTNPLFLLVALEELRGFGSFKQLNRRIELLPSEGDTVTALFNQVIDRLEDDFDRSVVRALLSLLASARRGLSERELLDLIEGAGIAISQSKSDLFAVLRQIRSYLQHRGQLLDFFHRNFYKAVRDQYVADDEACSATHAQLAEYFGGQDYFLESLEEQRARAKRLPPTPRPANIRKVDELPWQLLQVAKLSGKDDPESIHWNAVADLFTDLHFLEAKAEAQA